MEFLVPVLTPILVAVLATLLARDSVRDRGMYFLIALLLAAGAQSVLGFLASFWPAIPGDYFLEHREKPNPAEMFAAMEAEARRSTIVSLCAAAMCVPLLRYLAASLRR